jgi:hypothetical protein
MTNEQIETYKIRAAELVENDQSFDPREPFWAEREKKLITALLITCAGSLDAAGEIQKLLLLPETELFTMLQANTAAAPFVAVLIESQEKIRTSIIMTSRQILDRAATGQVRYDHQNEFEN